MLDHSGFPAKALGTPIMGAPVGTLPGVYPSMPCQTGGIREPFVATLILTFMRFLSRMSADVHCQGTALNEALPAVLVPTLIWPLVRMDAIVTLEVRLAVKALAARFPGAFEWTV